MSINQQEFINLHDEYRPRLVNSMTGIVRDRDAAEEVTAAAFAKAYEKRNTFRGESSLYTWVYAIAKNEARRRASQNRPVSLDALPLPPSALVVEDRVGEASERSGRTLRLRTALGSLPAVYRRVLVDHFVRGWPVKRIACQSRIPVGTVLSRIFKAKRLLRAAWGA
jgi:RNA polymerase sigma-70 factor (ECF subfamily)